MWHLLLIGIISAGATIVVLTICIAHLCRECGRAEGRCGLYEEMLKDANDEGEKARIRSITYGKKDE